MRQGFKQWMPVLAMLVLLSGCTASAIQETELETANRWDLQQPYWWRVKFRIHWPEGEDLDFSIHSLIADLVLRPVLDQHGDSLVLWRFHRRAARDGAGHQFSFIFYTASDVAEAVNADIQQNSVNIALLEAGTLDKVLYHSMPADERKQVEATSDPVWSPEIQKSWPWYIMGVSQTWLDMIAQLRTESPMPANPAVAEMQRYYKALDAKITDQWGRYGRHAYLHHLNAVFGYVPVYIEKTGTWEYF